MTKMTIIENKPKSLQTLKSTQSKFSGFEIADLFYFQRRP